MTSQDRLGAAADATILQALIPYGFRPSGAASANRGSSVTYTNECLELSVSADWLEGELEVSLRPVGGREVPLSAVVDLEQAHGLSLTRVPRGITRGMLEQRLRQVGELLVAQAHDVLSCSQAALARLTT